MARDVKEWAGDKDGLERNLAKLKVEGEKMQDKARKCEKHRVKRGGMRNEATRGHGQRHENTARDLARKGRAAGQPAPPLVNCTA